MDILLIILIYGALTITSTALMIWDWNIDGLDVTGKHIFLFFMLSMFGFMFFIPVLGIKLILHKIGIGDKVIFKAKR